MSNWEVDGVSDNAWSSFDEVAWTECESKGDHIVPESGMLRGTSCTPIEPLRKGAGESSGHVQKLSEQVYQRLQKFDHADRSIAGEIFSELNTRESSYRAKAMIVSPSKRVWREYTPESSLTVLPFNTSNRSSSVIRGGPEVDFKKEVYRYDSEGGIEVCKDELAYHDDGADIVNSSCHFLLSDMCPPEGDLEFLAEVHEDTRRDNLLEYGWGNTSNNLEDIDKLFSSTSSMLSRGFDNNTDGMLWEPPSPTLGDSLQSMHQPVTVPVSPAFMSRGVVKGFESNTDLSTVKNNEASTKHETGFIPEEWSVPDHSEREITDDPCLPMQVDECSRGNTWESRGPSEGRCRGSENMGETGQKACKIIRGDPFPSDDGSTQSFKEGEKWKTSKARRHGPRSKRLEANSRRPLCGRKLALNLAQAKKSPLIYVPVVPIAQESPPVSQVTRGSSCEPMQCMQPVPFVHAGFGFPAHHHLPVVVPSPSVMPQQQQPQAQPVFIGFQPPFINAPKLQQINTTFDVPSQSPTASSTMTPQEKIEKLRWRQKMQARLAVEQQQQQLINERLIPEQTQFGRQQNHQIHPQQNSSEQALGGSVRLAHSQCAEPSIWNEKSVSVEGAMIEDGEESLAASVLHQLLNIASKMDTRTRLCLRDGFRRLARNAMQRRSAGDSQDSKRNNSEPSNRSCTTESSSSSEQSCSQRLLTVDDIVETETNPMDRFIAHLLFHQRFPSSFMPLYIDCTPCNNSENPEPGLLHQSAWPWNEGNTPSGISPATRSSSVSGEFGSSKGPNTSSDIPVPDNFCEKQIDRPACLSSIVSGLQLEKILNFSVASADDSLQLLVERETDMADMDTVFPAVSTSSGNKETFGEVEEPPLQEK